MTNDNLSELFKQKFPVAFKTDWLAQALAKYKTFDGLLAAALRPQPSDWRAVWLLRNVTHKNDDRLQPFVTPIIDRLPTDNESLNRELLVTLQNMELDPRQEGKLFATCVGLWENTKVAQSVRYNALKIVLPIARKYPELQNEIRFLLDERYLEGLTKGVRYSVGLMVEKI